MNIVEIKREIKNIAITGGMGFIGSNFIRYLREDVGFKGTILNIDKLTYAGNPNNLSDLENKHTFLKLDICDILDIDFVKIFDDCKIDLIINMAAESHVDKSIYGPSDFIKTNILGTFYLLEAVRKINKNIIFYQVSCYDEKTRALTIEGLKYYKDIKIGDKVLSLNPTTGFLEEKKIKKIIVQDYSGDMIEFKSKKMDLVVTPNHRMFFKTNKSKNKKSKIVVDSAEYLYNSRETHYLPISCWKGREEKEIYIEGIGYKNAYDVFYLLGVFLGDGFTAYQEKKTKNKTGLDKKTYMTYRDSKGRFYKLSEKKGDNEYTIQRSYRIFFDVPENKKARKPLEDTLTRLGITFSKHKGRAGEHVYFTSKEWLSFFLQFGKGALNKYIPKVFLEYSTEHLSKLLQGLTDTDGSYLNKIKSRYTISTSSKKLRDNILEIGMKLGKQPRFSIREPKEIKYKERIIKGNSDNYMIYFRNEEIEINNKFIKKNFYSGKIWCLSVEDNKNLIIERNGILTISGNTDEVFGSLPEFGYFNEHSRYDPRSVYSASKASADHLVKAYYHTYGIPILMSNCSNNYGPYQFPEKLIPLMILNMLERKPLPVYGDGKQIRDWLYVKDHCEAIWTIITKGEIGESYNIGGDNEKTNIEIIDILCELVSDHTGVPINVYRNLITHVTDRPGHDRRYAVNCDKIKRFLGWKQHMSFYLGMDSTVKWYIDNKKWINDIKTGEYLKWIENNYKDR